MASDLLSLSSKVRHTHSNRRHSTGGPVRLSPWGISMLLVCVLAALQLFQDARAQEVEELPGDTIAEGVDLSAVASARAQAFIPSVMPVSICDQAGAHCRPGLFVSGAFPVQGSLIKAFDTAFQAAGRAQVAIVEFDSMGGSTSDGLLLGQQLADQKIDTLVRSGSTCISSCVYAFAGGRQRSLSPTAIIGLHQQAAPDPPPSQASSLGDPFQAPTITDAQFRTWVAHLQRTDASILFRFAASGISMNIPLLAFATPSGQMAMITPGCARITNLDNVAARPARLSREEAAAWCRQAPATLIEDLSVLRAQD